MGIVGVYNNKKSNTFRLQKNINVKIEKKQEIRHFEILKSKGHRTQQKTEAETKLMFLFFHLMDRAVTFFVPFFLSRTRLID